jgi:hypothetical protein
MTAFLVEICMEGTLRTYNFKISRISWITLPKNNFTKKIDRKAIWPKHHLTELRLTECHLTESSFDRKVIWPIFFQKMAIWQNLLSTKNVIWPKKMRTRSFDRKFIWPKIHLTESFFWKWSFDRKFIWPKAFSKNGHLIDFFFWKIVVFEKLLFDRMFIFHYSICAIKLYYGRMQIKKWEKLFWF